MSCLKLKSFFSDFLKYFSSFSDLAKITVESIKTLSKIQNLENIVKMYFRTLAKKFNQAANDIVSIFVEHFVPNFRYVISLEILVMVVHEDWKQVTENSSKLFWDYYFVLRKSRVYILNPYSLNNFTKFVMKSMFFQLELR